MSSSILYRNQHCRESFILDEAYRVDVCEDTPLCTIYPAKFIVILHAGPKPLQLSFESEVCHASVQLQPRAICALPLKPSLCIHWKGVSDLLLLSLDHASLNDFATHNNCNGTDLNRGYVLQNTSANVQAGFLIDEFFQKPMNHRTLYLTLQAFLIQLLRNCNLNTWVKTESPLLTPDLQRVIRYIKEHLNEDLTVDELAASIGLSRRQFFRNFRKAMGLNPHQWILRFRLQEAETLLHDPLLTIAEIANLTGFADQSHFTRKFRRLYKCTPHQYKRLEDNPKVEHIQHMEDVSAASSLPHS